MTLAADQKMISRVNWGFGLGIPAVLAAAFIAQIHSYKPTDEIKSPKYNAPNGCLVRPYAVMDRISASCVDHAYVIPYDTAVSTYGWQPGRASRDYYRVGDNAYQIRCEGDNPQVCEVAMTQYHAFAR